MRAYLISGLCVLCLFAPAVAEARPASPVIASHDTEARARFVDHCPRRDESPCHLLRRHRHSDPVPFHPGGKLSIKASEPIRELRLTLDCRHADPRRVGRKRWTIEIVGDICWIGRLDLSYRRPSGEVLRVRYTFTLENHDHSNHQGHCNPDETATVIENESIRVYFRWSGVDYDPYYPEREYFVCRWDSDKTVRIGTDYCGDAYDACYYIENLRLAGEKVAYVSGRDGDRYGRWSFTLNVLDTATWVTDRVFGESNSSGDSQGYRRVNAVVLKENGSIAWIADLWDYEPVAPYWTQTYELLKRDATGDSLVDSDPKIDTRSRRLTGSTLTWSVDGESRSAALN